MPVSLKRHPFARIPIQDGVQMAHQEEAGVYRDQALVAAPFHMGGGCRILCTCMAFFLRICVAAKLRSCAEGGPCTCSGVYRAPSWPHAPRRSPSTLSCPVLSGVQPVVQTMVRSEEQTRCKAPPNEPSEHFCFCARHHQR